MKINYFEEKINSKYMLLMMMLSILFCFINRNFLFDIPIYLFAFGLMIFQKLRWFDAFKIILAAFVFSFFCAYFIIFFPNEALSRPPFYDFFIFHFSKELIALQFKVFIRVSLISSLSFASIWVINFEKVLIDLMKNKKISTHLGYPILLAFNSVKEMRAEYERIQINAKFRKLSFMSKMNIFFPLLVFAIRHADRGAMSLTTRGLNQDKSYFFDTQTKLQDRALLALLIVLILICGLGQFFLR